MLARLCAFVIWAVVGAAAMFWILRLTAGSESLPAYAVAVDRTAPLRGDLTRLFGAGPLQVVEVQAPVESASRYKLIGVMAPKGAAEGEGRYGLALIAVDGKPPRAYPVGARVDGDVIVQAVSLRTAALGPPGGKGTVLELPALPPAATGSLPPPGAGSLPPPGAGTVIAPPPAPAMRPVPPALSLPPPPQAAPVVPAPTTPAPIPAPGVSPPLPGASSNS